MLGGMIWPSVPEAATVPVASSFLYPRRSMVGTASRPMVTTVAPTIPVEAPSRAPTTTTEMASPPRRRPNSSPMVSSSSSARPERSSMTPMKTNRGTAIKRYIGHHPPDAQGQQVEKGPAEADEAEAHGGSHQA